MFRLNTNKSIKNICYIRKTQQNFLCTCINPNCGLNKGNNVCRTIFLKDFCLPLIYFESAISFEMTVSEKFALLKLIQYIESNIIN